MTLLSKCKIIQVILASSYIVTGIPTAWWTASTILATTGARTFIEVAAEVLELDGKLAHFLENK